MSRSLRKGPYIQEALEKRILAMNDGSKKKEVVKTWSRASMISPDFVGHTVAVHNGNKFIPVYITEHGGPQARRIRADQNFQRPFGQQ